MPLVLTAIIASAVSFDYCLGEDEQRPKIEFRELTIEERIAIQEQQLEDIKEDAAKKRREIEDSYAYRYQLLQRWTVEYISTFKLPHRVLWTEFIKAYNNISYTDSCIETGQRFKLGTYLLEPALALDPVPFYFYRPHFKVYWPDFKTRQTLRKMLLKHYQILQMRKLFLATKEIKFKLIRLEKQKALDLAEIDQWEKQRTEEVLKIIQQIKTAPKPIDYGMVNVICYDDAGACCMIEGVEGIVRQGTKIDNIRVSEILPDRVKFRRRFTTWFQLIGQSPNKLWEEVRR